MKRLILVALAVVCTAAPAAAAGVANVSGGGALALATLVGQHAPYLSLAQKAVLRKYLDGRASAKFPKSATFAVKADSVVCRASNVDITAHSCELTFGAKKVSLKGRLAHELYATLVENGVPSDGAAGSIFEAIGALDCAIDPGAIADRAGGGATCTIAPAH